MKIILHKGNINIDSKVTAFMSMEPNIVAFILRRTLSVTYKAMNMDPALLANDKCRRI